MIINLDSQNRIRSGVVVTAYHPEYGALYWKFVSEASVGAPDHHGITDDIRWALVLDENWRKGPSSHADGQHMMRVLGDPDFLPDLRRGSRSLESDDGARDEFLKWMRSANWVDLPSPVLKEQLYDHGYFQEWVFAPCCIYPSSTVVSTDDAPIKESRPGSYELGLKARLDWMERRCYQGIGLLALAYKAEQRSIASVHALAEAESRARQNGRYRMTVPPILADVPELAQLYLDAYSYRVALQDAVVAVEKQAKAANYVPVTDPRMSFGVIKFLASRNTLQLFIKHGGFDLRPLAPPADHTSAMGVADGRRMLVNMWLWMLSGRAETEARAHGSDLGYVRHLLRHIKAALDDDYFVEHQEMMFLPSGWDDRQRDEDNDRADAYCHALYSSTPED